MNTAQCLCLASATLPFTRTIYHQIQHSQGFSINQMPRTTHYSPIFAEERSQSRSTVSFSAASLM